MEKLSVEVTSPSGNTITKSFVGRWLIDREEDYVPEDQSQMSWDGRRRIAVAETKKGRLVTLSFGGDD